MTADLGNPILNSPYSAPDQNFVLGQRGPTGELATWRWPSESFIPVPRSKKARNGEVEQGAFDLDTTGERREKHQVINDPRRRVELRWGRCYPWVTPMSRKLLAPMTICPRLSVPGTEVSGCRMSTGSGTAPSAAPSPSR